MAVVPPLWASGCTRTLGNGPVVGPPSIAAVAAACLLFFLFSPPAARASPLLDTPLPHFKSPDWGATLSSSEHMGPPAEELLNYVPKAPSPSGSPRENHQGPPLRGPLDVSLLSGLGMKEENEADLDFPVSLQCLIAVSFISLVLCVLLFLGLFFSHLNNYYEPKLQRMICRIGCALPIFAILSSAACFSVFSEIGDPRLLNLQGGPSSPSPENQLSPLQPEAAAVNTERHVEAGGPWTEHGGSSLGAALMSGVLVRELTAVSSLSESPSETPRIPSVGSSAGQSEALSSSSGGLSVSPVAVLSRNSSGGPSSAATERDLSEGPSGGRPWGAKGPSSRDSYYLQQQLFFELGKQLTQSTALYSFSALMINACGGYRCLSLTLGCDGHSVPFIFPFCHFLPPFLPNPRALRLLKLGVMQFVFVLPLWSAGKLLADRSTSRRAQIEALGAAKETVLRGSLGASIPDDLRRSAGQSEKRDRRLRFSGSEPVARLEGEAVIPEEALSEEVVSREETLHLRLAVPETITKDTERGHEAFKWQQEDYLWGVPKVVVDALLALVLSLSMFASMLSLSQFYLITEAYVAPYNPEGKFFLIKLLVFTNTWQRLIVGIVGTLWGLPGVGSTTGIGRGQGIELYHNLLMNIWALVFSVLHCRCFPVSEHLPEENDNAVSSLDSSSKPSIMHALLDVCFSVDLIVDAKEAVLTPQKSLDRAYSLLHQQTARHASFFRRLRETEEKGAGLDVAGETGGEPTGILPMRGPEKGDISSQLDTADQSPQEGLEEERSHPGPDGNGLLLNRNTLEAGGDIRSHKLRLWGPGASQEWHWRYGGSPESLYVSSRFSQQRSPVTPLYCSSSNSNSGDAPSAAAVVAALSEAATLSNYRSKTAREAARVRLAALACPTSPYCGDPTAALAIALGDLSPGFPISLSLLSHRLAAFSLQRSSSSNSSNTRPPTAFSAARRWASGEVQQIPGWRGPRKHSAPPRAPLISAFRGAPGRPHGPPEHESNEEGSRAGASEGAPGQTL